MTPQPAERITEDDCAQPANVIPRVITVVTTWSDGTVHIDRPGEATRVDVPVAGASS